MASTNSEYEKNPLAVKLAFSGFKTEGDKWFATCKKCNTMLTERKTATSGITKKVKHVFSYIIGTVSLK
jgi:hypothetical protein